MYHKIISIIPARGGSKGIPLKNIKPLNGKPLIYYTINASFNSTLIDRTIVSTDHSKIASIAQHYGAEVIKRPKKLSGDKASSESAILHAVEHLRKREDYIADIIVFLQCTSPFIYPSDIDGAINKLINENADCVFSAVPFHGFVWGKDSKGNMNGINHDKRIRNIRQTLSPQYIETGSIYVMKTKEFMKKQHRFFGKITIYEINKDQYIDIDDENDFEIAESLFHLHSAEITTHLLPKTISAVVLDFDGVFTDNRVIVFENGQEAVICNRGDGMGLDNLKNINIPVLVLSKEGNPVIKMRCKKLGLEYKYGIDNKLRVLKQWLKQKSLKAENVIYVGNDINDIPCMDYVGCSVCVNDAHKDVKKVSSFVLESNGGYGAIREICDILTMDK